MSTLVIKDWQADSKPVDADKNFIRITGREGGLLAWLLSRMKVDPTTSIRVGLDRMEFSAASLAGTEVRMIPLQNISSSYYGYHKPWKVALSILIGFGFAGTQLAKENGSFSTFLITAGIGLLIAAAYYVLNRTLTLGFIEHSGMVNGIRFKRSIIENKDISEAQAREVCMLLQRLIELKGRRNAQA